MHTGIHQGWLSKGPVVPGSASKSAWVSGMRLVTIDFDEQVFFYSGSSGRAASVPLTFSEIQGASSGSASVAGAGATRCCPVVVQPEFRFTLNTRSRGHHSLVASSADEQSRWVALLQAAAELGGNARPALQEAEKEMGAAEEAGAAEVPEAQKTGKEVKDAPCKMAAEDPKATEQAKESNCMECSTTASSLSSLWASHPDEDGFLHAACLAACLTHRPLAAPRRRCQSSRQAVARDSLETSTHPVLTAAAELLLASNSCSSSSSGRTTWTKRLPRVASDPAMRRPTTNMSKAERRAADLDLLAAPLRPNPAGQRPRQALELGREDAMLPLLAGETTWKPASRMSAQDRRKADLMLAGRTVQGGLHHKSPGPA